MKKRMKMTLIGLFALTLLAAVFPPMSAEAKTKNVTSKYKKQVNKIMNATELYYELFMVYDLDSGETQKVSLSAKGKMRIAAGYEGWHQSSSTKVSNAVFKKKVKNLFGSTANVKLLPSKSKALSSSRVLNAYVYRKNSSYVGFLSGDLGYDCSYYKLKSITQSGKTYMAVYQFYNEDDGYLMGKVTLKLKRASSSSYGFNITGVTIKNCQ